MDRFPIHDISEMPAGQALETPLHPHRKHKCQPFVTATSALQSTSQTIHSIEPKAKVKVELVSTVVDEPSMCPRVDVPHKSSSISISSSATLIECGNSYDEDAPMRPSIAIAPPQVKQNICDEDVSLGLHYGSEQGSDESDDEETVSPMIPRAFRNLLETPTDGDEDQPTIQETSVFEDVAMGGTEKPWHINHFEWRPFPDPPIPPELRREMFSASNVGPTTPYIDPYDIFIAIWDRKFMEHIACETNRYAQQVATQLLHDNELRPTSRIAQWRDTTVDELYVYFGLILAMGVVVKSRIEEYWNSTADIFYTPGFGAHMSINRFILLNKCLHFQNNEDMCTLRLDASQAKLFKIQPVISHLNNKFQSLYNLHQNISLDESLLQWKGWLDINQLIPNKAATMGIKTYEICESQTGYLWRFEIYTYKQSLLRQWKDPLSASTPTVVLRLIHGLEYRGHTLWMDNFYNSPCLARRLKSIGFDCVGTLRTNRLFVPEYLHNLTKANMRPGQITGSTSGDVDVMVWRDNNKVAMISTYHGNAVQSIRETTKPILILDYNVMMGGVDKKDQMLAMYPIERKRTKIWYKKLFRRLLNVSVLNSYIIHKQNAAATSLTHRGFRTSLAKSLLSNHSSASLPPVTPVTPQKRIDISHRLEEYPFVKHQRQRRVCKVCKKRVHTFCVGCNKTVCIGSCFVTIH